MARKKTKGKSTGVKGIVSFIIAVVVAIIAGQMTVKHLPPATTPTAQVDKSFHRVTRVVDGDTIVLDNKEHVRLIGVDTPESRDNPKLVKDAKRLKSDKQAIIAMGKKAASFTRQLVEGKTVRVDVDIEPRDRYKRLLGYVYLEDGTFVNEKIIREGYAYPLTIPPNVRYADVFKQAFDEAREARRGLWR